MNAQSQHLKPKEGRNPLEKKDCFVRVYTDGAFSLKDRTGAAAFTVLNADYSHRFSDGVCYENTTANRVELLAAIHALDWCNLKIPQYRPVLYTDSTYVKQMQYWIPYWRKRTGWTDRYGEIIKNLDLVILFLLKVLDSKHDIETFWVAGHQGNKGNELAHEAASQIARGDQSVRDLGGFPLLTARDIERACEPEDVTTVIRYCPRLDSLATPHYYEAIP